MLEFWNCTNEEYHADLTHDSHSSLDLFMRSVEEYAALRVFKSVPKPEPTDEMIFGSLFHTVALEPEKFEEEYVIAEKFDRRTKVGKAAYAEFSKKCNGKRIVTKDEYDMAQDMYQGMLRNPAARSLLNEEGVIESAMKVVFQGCPLKVRLDFLANCTIVDLKSTKDPSPSQWNKSVLNFGYHRQAELYMTVANLYGIHVDRMLFLAVGKTPPHECVVYELDSNWITLGRNQNRCLLHELSERRKNNDWSGRYSGKINRLTPPPYASFN